MTNNKPQLYAVKNVKKPSVRTSAFMNNGNHDRNSVSKFK